MLLTRYEQVMNIDIDTNSGASVHAAVCSAPFWVVSLSEDHIIRIASKKSIKAHRLTSGLFPM